MNHFLTSFWSKYGIEFHVARFRFFFKFKLRVIILTLFCKLPLSNQFVLLDCVGIKIQPPGRSQKMSVKCVVILHEP